MRWAGDVPNPVTWENLNSALLKEFPVLQSEEFSKLIDGFEGWEPGPYVLFGSVFNPFILQSVSDSPEGKSKIAQFVERMAQADVGNIDDLLEIEVLPTFLRSQDLLDAYWSHLGKNTQKQLRRLAIRHVPAITLPESMN